ncbi:EXOSC10 [Symbiodinium pilosum]|uniref:EXOSC10 protein n=1 Tax=Symbiodinium pilosum TaxID=2952 RepID=A0A812X470_SYMPI|nr:EXOSC10 [Symbiodinium pilosum]
MRCQSLGTSASLSLQELPTAELLAAVRHDRMPELRQDDFVYSVLAHGPKQRAEVTWPPFPAKADRSPPKPHSPRQEALRRGGAAQLSTVSIQCCQALLDTRANVAEATLTSALRRGLGLAAAERPLMEALVQTPSAQLSWPLVAASAANCPAAVTWPKGREEPKYLQLLPQGADDTDGLAFTAAASSEECLPMLLEDGAVDEKVSLLEAWLLQLQAMPGYLPLASICIKQEQQSQLVLSFRTFKCTRSASAKGLLEGDQQASWQNLLKPAEVTSVSLKWAETLAEAQRELRFLEDDLSGQAAILGVDVECYADVVCTIQLATAKRTIVLDALQLHNHMADLVGQIFSNGSVLKLFHAPRNDLRWLWANFGIQVVNMFDTYTAAWLVEDASQEDKPAERGRSSLKGLCQRFLQIELDKTHQRSDWRLRPLPEEMLRYAARDAEVLLPLAKRLASMADSAGMLEECRQSCRKQQADVLGGEGISVELLDSQTMDA